MSVSKDSRPNAAKNMISYEIAKIVRSLLKKNIETKSDDEFCSHFDS